jgi:LytS/YehU family sensor histidine kinase
LVENAIRHGISRRGSGGTVTVTAERGGNQVEIRVADDGVGLPAGWTLETSAGTGLSVTRERILGLHPDANSSLSIRPRAVGGTEVCISLPLRLVGAG